MTDKIKELWENATEPTEAELRRLYGDCHACLEAGNATPGIGTERGVWVDPYDHNVVEGEYNVCEQCMQAANGGPGYYPA